MVSETKQHPRRKKAITVQVLRAPSARPTAAALWRTAEKENREFIQDAAAQMRFRIKFPHQPIAIAFIADQHISPRNVVAVDTMREHADLVRRTPRMYAVLGGDAVDNHIKHTNAIISARSQPDDQWNLFRHYLNMFGDSLLLILSGNHEMWTNQLAGVNLLKSIAADFDTAYANFEARITAIVGNQSYRLALRHSIGRYNSTANPCHAVKQWYRHGADTFDIGVLCHHHEPSLEHFYAHGDMRYAARPGSYQILSAYSMKLGAPPTMPLCPVFILSGTRRQILPMLNIELCPTILRKLPPSW